MKINLKDHEREYLKKILWELFKDKVSLPETHQKLSIEEAEKLPEFQSYKSDPSYFLVPLKKRMDPKKWWGLTTQDIRASIGKAWEEFTDN